MNAAAPPPPRVWHGAIDLRCHPRVGKTAVSAKHRGPLRVQRAFYPEADGTAHVYLLHPPGGMVEGDDMQVNLQCDGGAQALVTTPGAGKFYRSLNHPSRWSQTLVVKGGGVLEWLPQETIVFDGACAELNTHIELDADSRFVGWDIVCFGRNASRELFNRGKFDSRLTARVDGKLRVNERMRLEHPEADRAQAWFLRGATVTGTLLAYPADEYFIAAVRAQLIRDVALTSATLLRGGVAVCRYLGHDSAQAMQWLRDVWRIARRDIARKEAVSPRIWAT